MDCWQVSLFKWSGIAALGLVFFGAATVHAQNSPDKNSAVDVVAARPIFSVGGFAGGVAGNFNHDKKADFALGGQDQNFGNPLNPVTTVLINKGDGAFTATDNSKEFFGAPALALDLNGDGVDDLVVPALIMDVGFEVRLANGDGTFAPGVNHFTNQGGIAGQFVAGDFNNDGRMDLAFIEGPSETTAGHSSVEVYFNTGGGSLQFTAFYPLGINPVLAAGDLNGDHKADLVIFTGSSMTPLLSVGDGSFMAAGAFDTGAAFIRAVVGDFNNDGYADVAGITSQGITLMLGGPGGTFTRTTPIHATGLAYIVLGDFNKDKNLDLAVASADGYVSVYPGTGTGSFSNPKVYNSLNFDGISSLMVADVNGDGNPDLATTDSLTGSLSILLSNGFGTFFQAAPNTSSPGATGIVAADFNGDGKSDVAVVNTPSCKAPCGGKVTVFTGSGANYFNAGKAYPIGMHGSAIAAGDLKGDGRKDLVVVNATPGDRADVSVLLGNKDGTFQAAQNYTLGSLSNDVFLVDVNKDGKLDLVEDGGVALGNGDGTFGTLTAFPGGLGYVSGMAVGGRPPGGSHIAVGDFNNDGAPDVAFTYFSHRLQAPFIQILLGNGKGGFTNGQLIAVSGLPIASGQPIVAIAAGALHGGTVLDLAVASAGDIGLSPTFHPFATGVEVFVGKGNGTFEPATNSEATGFGAVGSISPEYYVAGPLAIADFNGDGMNDIAVSGTPFVIVPGDRGATFYDADDFDAHGLPRFVEGGGIAVADFDRNGLPDVVVTNAKGIARLYSVAVPRVSPPFLAWNGPPYLVETVTITNTLKTGITIGIDIEPGGLNNTNTSPAFLIQRTTCKNTLTPGASCTATVGYEGFVFEPHRANLLITSNGRVIAKVLMVAASQ